MSRSLKVRSVFAGAGGGERRAGAGQGLVSTRARMEHGLIALVAQLLEESAKALDVVHGRGA